MSALSKKIRLAEGDTLLFHCPGCDDVHGVCFSPGRWTWNNDAEKPTFHPSVLVTSGHFTPDWKTGEECWCTYNAAHPREPTAFKCQRCHSWVRDGRIEFLADSTHALSGQTVDLPEWTE